MRVLGVDPGLTRCGVGVVEGAPGRPLPWSHVGVVRTPTPTPRLGHRLHAIETRHRRSGWTRRYRPDAVAVERVFSQHNVAHRDGHRPGQRRSPCCAAARRGMPVALHTPSEVKAAVTGSGRRDKAQVTRDGHRGCCGSTPPPKPGRRRRRARAGHLPRLARRHARPAAAAGRHRGRTDAQEVDG